MDATWIALIPPLLAIIISLITKEVNLSLVVGIVAGCGLYCGFNACQETAHEQAG